MIGALTLLGLLLTGIAIESSAPKWYRPMKRAVRRRINAWRRNVYRRRMARDMGWRTGWRN